MLEIPRQTPHAARLVAAGRPGRGARRTEVTNATAAGNRRIESRAADEWKFLSGP
ncbi:MAG: hypothetical protein OJF61_001044 [Rhodanobacteraceae bacterium]|nr:MAG: hypothetical protein OJF61_001044 [Rhodanobacteraceae bacterium]